MNNPSKFLEKLFYENELAQSSAINNYPVLIMLWNICLLFIPYFLCIFLITSWRQTKFKKFYQKLLAMLIGLLWLLFIPNSAYIITDVRHLLNYCDVNFYRVCAENAWMIMFFFIYASVGWVALVLLLNQMKKFIADFINYKASQLFIFIIIPLVSTGVLIGLINRWNSWDIFIHPWLIFISMLRYFTDIIYFRDWAVFTVGLYLLYFVGDWLFRNNKVIK